MLETQASDLRNRTTALVLAGTVALLAGGLAILSPPFLIGLPFAGLVYWLWRRRTVRRLRVIAEPLDEEIEAALMRDVVFYRGLSPQGQARFRNLVKVFLDEVTITGIGTEVDAGTRALVAASAVMPIFGFDDWEYSGLGEVLIYPNRFGEDFSTGPAGGDGDLMERRTLGMVGVGHLSGVMILSKPDLIAGFENPDDKRNVGIHEFAHLVDKEAGGIDGLPGGLNRETAGPWIQWVGDELRRRPQGRHHIDSYAYSNEAEYFAVLSEYFFEAPATLQAKAPKIYKMLQSMYRQNTRRILSGVGRPRRRVGRNAPCPCGSGKKYKRCCRRKRIERTR